MSCCKTALSWSCKYVKYHLHLDKKAGYLNARGLIQKARGVKQRQRRKVKWEKSMATFPFSRALSIPRSPNRMNPGKVTKK